MKRRTWILFLAWQTAGALVGLGASHVDTLSWGLAALMLLPGTLLDWFFFKRGGVGNSWPKWAVFVIPIAANLVLFALLAMVRNRSREANPS